MHEARCPKNEHLSCNFSKPFFFNMRKVCPFDVIVEQTNLFR